MVRKGVLTGLTVGLVLLASTAWAALSRPTNVVATALSSSQISLTFEDTNNREDSYDIERSMSATTGFVVVASPVGCGDACTVTYTDGGLVGCKQYFYRIRAKKGGGNFSPYSDVANATTSTPCPSTSTTTIVTTTSTTTSSTTSTTAVTTTSTTAVTTTSTTTTSTTTTATTTTTTLADVTPPSQPGTLSASPGGTCSSVNLFWGVSTDSGGSGLRGYNLYRGGVFVRQFTPGGATSGVDTGLTGSTLYSYTLKAVDNAGNESSAAGPASATTSACSDTTPPSVPQNVNAFAVSCHQTTLSWDPSTDNVGGSGVNGYDVYRGGAFLFFTGNTAVSDLTVSASTLYSYTVQAVDYFGNASALSTAATVTTPACPTTTTTTTIVTTTSTTAVTTTSTTAVTTTSTTATTTTSTTTTATTSSTTTTTMPDTMAPSVPTGVSASPTSCSATSLSWSASADTGGSGLRGYNISRNGSFLKQVLAPTTSTTDTGLAASTGYTYTVAAIDNAGNQSASSASSTATTSACMTTNPVLVGYVPSVGTAFDLSLAGTTMYVASKEFGTAVVDVGTPASMVAKGGQDVPIFGQRVSVSGTRGAMTGTSAAPGIRLLDLTNPLKPVVKATVDGTRQISDILVSGTTLYAQVIYAGNPATVHIKSYNISSLTSPTGLTDVQVVAASGTGANGHLALSGTRLYRASGDLDIFDTANMGAVLGTAVTSGSASDVAINGNFAYVADGTGIQVVDVTNGAAPVLGQRLNTAATSIGAAGTKMAASNGLQLLVYDTSNPGGPVLQSTSPGYDSVSVAMSGSTVFLADSQPPASPGEGGLYAISIANPTVPQKLGNISGAWDAWGISVSGTTAVATANLSGLRTVNVTDPMNPVVLKTLLGTYKGVVLASTGYAYALAVIAGNPAHLDLQVIDARTPSNPVVVGSVTIPSAGSGVELACAGTTCYMFAQAAGIQVINVSNPTAPVLGALIDTPGTANAGWVLGTKLYEADTTALRVYDVTTPGSPSLLGSLTVGCYKVAAAGTKAHCLDGSSYRSIDVTNPGAMSVTGAVSNVSSSVAASGTLSYLSAAGVDHNDPVGGVYVYDVSGNTPTLVRQVIVPGVTRSLAVQGNYLYAGDSQGIVDIINLTQ